MEEWFNTLPVSRNGRTGMSLFFLLKKYEHKSFNSAFWVLSSHLASFHLNNQLICNVMVGSCLPRFALEVVVPSTYRDYQLAEKQKFSNLSPFSKMWSWILKVFLKSCHFKASTGVFLMYVFLSVFYVPEYCLPWWVFHRQLKRVCILLLLGLVDYHCWLDTKFFKSSVSLISSCHRVLSIIESSGVLKPPIMTMNFSNSPSSSTSFWGTVVRCIYI